MIFFIHIPKTAGTSLHALFEANFPRSSIAFVYGGPPWVEQRELVAWPKPKVAALNAVYGHYGFGLAERLGVAGSYATFLRRPRERLVSTYHHMVREGFAKELSIGEFFTGSQAKNMDNFAVRMISGVDHDRPFGGMKTADLEAAKANLQSRFATFGLVEAFAPSLERFISVFKLKPAPIGFRNVAPKAQEIAPPEGEVAEVLERNQLDQDFYDFAQTLFKAG